MERESVHETGLPKGLGTYLLFGVILDDDNYNDDERDEQLLYMYLYLLSNIQVPVYGKRSFKVAFC